MSKSDRILELLDRELTTRDIADVVGCDTAYVRVVQQRQKKHHSYWGGWTKATYMAGDRDAARRARATAYRDARNNGSSVRESSVVGFNVYSRTLYRTGKTALAANKP